VSIDEEKEEFEVKDLNEKPACRCSRSAQSFGNVLRKKTLMRGVDL